MSLTYAPCSVPISFGFGSKRSLHLIERNMAAYRRMVHDVS